MFSSALKATSIALGLSELFAPSLNLTAHSKTECANNAQTNLNKTALPFEAKFSSVVSDELQTIASAQLPKLTPGFQSAADLFGLMTTDLVREVRLHSINRAGPGHFDGNGAITLHINCLFGSDPEVLYRARHEALHAVDDWYRLQNGEYLSAGAFEAWFDVLKTENEWFLVAINGQNFYPNMFNLDHAQDHHVEFFETLVSSLLHPDWQDGTAGMSSEFFELYQKSLVVLRKRIVDCTQTNAAENILTLIDSHLD